MRISHHPAPSVPRFALRVGEAAASLGLGQRTTEALIASGELESIQVGKRRLVPVTALEAFVARKRGEKGGDDDC